MFLYFVMWLISECCLLLEDVAIDDTTVAVAFAGDNAILTITGVDIINTSIGNKWISFSRNDFQVSCVEN